VVRDVRRLLTGALLAGGLVAGGCAHGARPAGTPPTAATPATGATGADEAAPPTAAAPALAPEPVARLDFEPARPPGLILLRGFEPGEAGDATSPVPRPPEPLAVAAAPAPAPPGLRGLCRQGGSGPEPFLEDTRRWLAETFCGATLWFDGLFGGEPSIENARSVSGRVELSTIYTEAEGVDPKARLRLRYDLPNLERRINLFLDRDDREEFVEDRREGLAIRSSVFGLEDEDEWLAGLGYTPPGRYFQRVDFRVGGKVKSAPEVFVQARWRRNVFLGERSVLRLRETLFYENRDGFGATTGLDADRVLGRDLLLRYSVVGTFSEAADGVEWRSAFVLYKNLGEGRALAAEAFSRGETEAPVELREYGTRLVYRRPLGVKRHLFGELIAGYTFPRKDWQTEREGSAMLGFGLELLFGDPDREGRDR
jgi:hypothetical protein